MTSPLLDEIARGIERRMELALKVDKLEAAIQRVRELHAYDPDAICTSCNYLHPCPTLKALDGDSSE